MGEPGLGKGWGTSPSNEAQHLEMTPGVTSVPSLLKSSSQLGDAANSSCQLTGCVSAVRYSSSPRGQIQFIQANICLFIPSTSKRIMRQYPFLDLSSDKASSRASLHRGGFTSSLCTFSPHFQPKHIPDQVFPICSCASMDF